MSSASEPNSRSGPESPLATTIGSRSASCQPATLGSPLFFQHQAQLPPKPVDSSVCEMVAGKPQVTTLSIESIQDSLRIYGASTDASLKEKEEKIQALINELEVQQKSFTDREVKILKSHKEKLEAAAATISRLETLNWTLDGRSMMFEVKNEDLIKIHKKQVDDLNKTFADKTLQIEEGFNTEREQMEEKTASQKEKIRELEFVAVNLRYDLSVKDRKLAEAEKDKTELKTQINTFKRKWKAVTDTMSAGFGEDRPIKRERGSGIAVKREVVKNEAVKTET